MKRRLRRGPPKVRLVMYSGTLMRPSSVPPGENSCTPSPALVQALQTMGTPYQRFSFFQGLEVDDNVLDEVPA